MKIALDNMFNMLKEDEGDVFISAGNSGALLTGATLLVGRIRGIDRPAIAPVLPAYHGNVMLMDAGANTKKKITDKVKYYNVEVNESYSSLELSNAIGKNGRMVLGITNKNFLNILK